MLPVIDLLDADVPARIEAACRETGFFYLSGHGVSPTLMSDLDSAARDFFALPEEQKREIEMARGGRAWRGWFPVGDELTAGEADLKEGLYFGTELPAGHPLPLHGPNLFPRQVPSLRPLVLTYLDELTRVARDVMRNVALSLGLTADYTANPTVLFRIFHYPPADGPGWGVGEHTDYGLLTLLLQDDNGGLQVRTPDGWLDAPPLPGTFVCNIGDMLEGLSGGRYRSTPHRVRNTSGRSRLSFPFFFDPDFAATVPPFDGTYGDYLTAKVANVFPQLRQEIEQPKAR
jgi:isopenicillin N synthase-like dioxygenase